MIARLELAPRAAPASTSSRARWRGWWSGPAIPVVDGRLGLGTWQGIYLWEHGRAGGPRGVLVHLTK